MHARYYSPHLGRSLSVDPKLRRRATTDPQRRNRYADGRNNPLKFVDPDGREEKPANTSVVDTLANFLRTVTPNQNVVPNTIFMD